MSTEPDRTEQPESERLVSGRVDAVVMRFSSDGQRRKYSRIKKYFEKLIELKKAGVFFLVDGEVWRNPFISGFEMGFREENCTLLFLGGTHAYNKETDEYDIPWVDVSLKELKQRIVPLQRIDA